MDRNLFTSEILDHMRQALQTQLVTLALQRVPAFLELSFQKHACLAEAFVETCHLSGKIFFWTDTFGKALLLSYQP